MFGPTVPEHSMILLLGMIFSVIAPLVLAAAFMFFCVALLVESYNWVWVFRRPYEGGGRLWKQVGVHYRGGGGQGMFVCTHTRMCFRGVQGIPCVKYVSAGLLWYPFQPSCIRLPALPLVYLNPEP